MDKIKPETRQQGLQAGEEEVEIDLLDLFHALAKRWWAILLAILIGGGAAGAFSRYVLTPQYESTAMMYILSKETTLTSLADLQIGSQLTKDYQVIVVSRPVLEDVIETLGLNLDYKELKEKITIGNPSDTRILSVTVEDADPYMAKTIADTVASTASGYIGDIMEMVPPKMIEDGEVPLEQSSPNNLRNAALGALAGAVAVCGVITLGVVMNDAIEGEEDVAKYLGVSVLAELPERKGKEAPDGKERQPRNWRENAAGKMKKMRNRKRR